MLGEAREESSNPALRVLAIVGKIAKIILLKLWQLLNKLYDEW